MCKLLSIVLGALRGGVMIFYCVLLFGTHALAFAWRGEINSLTPTHLIMLITNGILSDAARTSKHHTTTRQQGNRSQ